MNGQGQTLPPQAGWEHSQPACACRSKSRWLPGLLVLVALLAGLYLPVVRGLVLQWWGDSSFSYGFLVPVFAGYVLWREQRRWLAVPIEPSNFGLVVMLAAIGLLIAGSLGAELFISRISLVVLLGGVVVFLAGWRMLKAVAFPLGYLILMIPLPALIYNALTLPLQLQASRLAAGSLEVLQVPVLREGNLLDLPNYTLEVVEACSGIRSLMSLWALAIAYGYLMESPRWVRIVLVGMVLPIAVASNALRVVTTGVLTYEFGPSWAEGFFHGFSGWVIFMTSLLFMVVFHGLLIRVWRWRRTEAHV